MCTTIQELPKGKKRIFMFLVPIQRRIQGGFRTVDCRGREEDQLQRREAQSVRGGELENVLL